MRSGPQPDDADFGRNLRRVQVLTRLFGFVLALAIVGTGIYAVVKGIQEEPSIVGSLATAMAAVLAVVYGQQRQANLDQKRAHREKLEPIYEELIERFRGDGPNNPKEGQAVLQQAHDTATYERLGRVPPGLGRVPEDEPPLGGHGC